MEVFVPTCFSPFSRNTLHLSSFEGKISVKSIIIDLYEYLALGTSLCSLSDQARIPKFFRVTDKDTAHFPRDSFTSLQLENGAVVLIRISEYVKTIIFSVNVVSKSVMNITFKIDLEFYYNEFDWEIIYR